jgi:hypothetical protein
MKKLHSYNFLKTKLAAIWIASGCALVMTKGMTKKMTTVAGHEKVAAGHEKMAAGHEKVVAGHEKVVAGHEKVVAGHEKVAAGHKKVVAGHEKVAAGHEKVAALRRSSTARSLGHRSKEIRLFNYSKNSKCYEIYI